MSVHGNVHETQNVRHTQNSTYIIILFNSAVYSNKISSAAYERCRTVHRVHRMCCTVYAALHMLHCICTYMLHCICCTVYAALYMLHCIYSTVYAALYIQ
eukprot:Lankesteria_metandrocarpae@DN5168_c0_g1_i15.p2